MQKIELFYFFLVAPLALCCTVRLKEKEEAYYIHLVARLKVLRKRGIWHIHPLQVVSRSQSNGERGRHFTRCLGAPLVNSFSGHCLWYMSKNNIQRQRQRQHTKTKTKTTYKDKDISPDVWLPSGQFSLGTLSLIYVQLYRDNIKTTTKISFDSPYN